MNKKSISPPSLSWAYAKPWRVLAIGMGSGAVRTAPGTWGTVWAWAVWLIALQFIPNALMPWLLIASFLIGIWACQRTGEDLGVADHGSMVWDEVVAFWLVLWLLPTSAWWMQGLAFATFRFFDIVKPAPIRYFDNKLAGGFGVMLDDVLAALYSLAFLYLIAYFI